MSAGSLDGLPHRLRRRHPEDLTVHVEPDGVAGHARLRVSGELDLATAPVLEQRLTALAGDGYQRLEVDVDGVGFCDVAGLRVLLDAQSALRERDGHLVLRNPRGSLRRLLSVLGLTDALSPDGSSEDVAGRTASQR